jgi:hypothetical protein
VACPCWAYRRNRTNSGAFEVPCRGAPWVVERGNEGVGEKSILLVVDRPVLLALRNYRVSVMIGEASGSGIRLACLRRHSDACRDMEHSFAVDAFLGWVLPGAPEE